MSDTWIILVHDLAPEQATWSQFDASGALLLAPKTGLLKEAAQGVKEDPVILVLPAAEVTHHFAQVPTQNKRQALAALPFSIEDKLAQDVTKCHVVVGTPLTDGRYPLAVVSKSSLTTWLQNFEDEGCLVRAIYSELQALPRENGIWTVAFRDKQVLLSLNANEGYVFDASWWVQGVQAVLAAQTNGKVPCLVYGATESLKTELAQEFPELDIKFRAQTVSWLEFIAPAVLRGEGINLAQQAFKPRKGFKGRVKIWKPAIIALAAALAFVVLHDLFLFNRAASLAENFSQEAEALYRKTFPQDSRIVNIKAQTESHIAKFRETNQEGQLFLLLGTLGEVMSLEESALLLSLGYNRLRTGLSVEVETQDYQAFERLRKALTKEAVVKVTTANITETNRVRGAFTLSLRNPI